MIAAIADIVVGVLSIVGMVAVYLIDRREWKRLGWYPSNRKGARMGAFVLAALAAIGRWSWQIAHRRHCPACARRAGEAAVTPELRRHRETGEIAQLLPTAMRLPDEQEQPPQRHWVCTYYEPRSGLSVRIVDDEIDAWESVRVVADDPPQPTDTRRA